jgi:hypothetical protein
MVTVICYAEYSVLIHRFRKDLLKIEIDTLSFNKIVIFFVLQIQIPFLFLNAVDDAFVPPELHHIPRDFACKKIAC